MPKYKLVGHFFPFNLFATFQFFDSWKVLWQLSQKNLQNVWRSWKITNLFKIFTKSTNLAEILVFYFTLDIMVHCNLTSGGNLLNFNTSKYLKKLLNALRVILLLLFHCSSPLENFHNMILLNHTLYLHHVSPIDGYYYYF